MKLFKKIDLFYNGGYICSTRQSKTCKDAVKAYLDRITYYKDYNTLVDDRIRKNPKLLKAWFAKD